MEGLHTLETKLLLSSAIALIFTLETTEILTFIKDTFEHFYTNDPIDVHSIEPQANSVENEYNVAEESNPKTEEEKKDDQAIVVGVLVLIGFFQLVRALKKL
jgi:hypothetical protein